MGILSTCMISELNMRGITWPGKEKRNGSWGVGGGGLFTKCRI